MKEARFYKVLAGDKVQCELCPHFCLLESGATGSCRVRKNINGKLFTLNYAKISSFALDPIEKKPLYHFHPKEYILSVGSAGCNFECAFCQNWTISQETSNLKETTSEFLIQQAKSNKSFGIAYTYNEPFIWYEFVFDTARLAKKEGLKNVLVTNGFVNQKPLEEMLQFIDAMNIDLKSMDEGFYQDICKGSLNPVLDTIKKSAQVCHVELTNLVIPGLNDKEDYFCKLRDWVFDNLGADIVVHLSRYFPCYKMDIGPTSLETLKIAQGIIQKKLKYVYLGNV
ncbi:MAG: AmmeMemoRadiSam system radical SAM enzyme [Candidatus Gygaella obscura]|nr:AmmeMemoRadiSam system radical SAM enzyme [Candidatus Gygaella obscura]